MPGRRGAAVRGHGPAAGRVTPRRARRDTEAGDTLLEILLALVVLGVSALAILLAFSTSIIGSSDYRTVASADTVLRTAAEQATSLIQQQPASAWTTCAEANLTSSQFTLPTGYSASVLPTTHTPSPIQYWNPSPASPAKPGFQTACVANQAVLVVITITHNTSTYQISIVVEDPQTRPTAPSGAAAQLVFIGQPGSTISGSSISPPPIVAVEDSTGNIVTNRLLSRHPRDHPGHRDERCVALEHLRRHRSSTAS